MTDAGRPPGRSAEESRGSGGGGELDCLLRDVAAAGARGGWRAAGRELRGWAHERIFRHGRLTVMEQDLDGLREIPSPAGVRIRRLELEPASTAGDWLAVQELAGARAARRFRSALGRGRVCLVAWRGERAIGYVWLADRVEADLETFPLPLPAGVAYAGTLFVTVDERRRGVGSALSNARLLEARSRGHRRAWRALDPTNRLVLQTNESRVVGALLYAKLLHLAVGYFRPAAPATGERAPGATFVRG